jgi:meiotic recombination protein REC8, fungi type
MGRHAPESLHGDHSSQMPWNASVSRHNSARRFRSGMLAGISSSIGGQGAGIEFGPASAFVARRGSRLTSASPLLGRGGTLPRYSSLELPEQPKVTGGEVGNGDIFGDGGTQLRDHGSGDDLEFQLSGPAAAVDTQTAAQSQWIAAALDTEANNFLAFLGTEIEAKIVAAERAGGQLEEQDMETVTFEGLLPPEQYSKVVAAQGLLHVLSLATKGVIGVRQEQAFGRIEISTVTAEEENEDGSQDMEV